MSEEPFVLQRYAKAIDGKFDELDFTDHAISDEDLKLLCDKIFENGSGTSLKRLVLQRCSISAKGLQAIGDLLEGGSTYGEASPLQSLVLSGNDLGPQGLACRSLLEGLKLGMNLRSLDLSCCFLCDEGIVPVCETLALRQPAVGEPPLLEELSFGCNRLGPEAAKTLNKCLATNFHLRTLDLQANVMGCEGAKLLVKGLTDNKGRLKKLNISQNEVQLAGAKALIRFFEVREFQFTISLMRPRGKSTGMTLTDDFVVTSVGPNSIVENWNHDRPCDAVFVGDRVIKVNGEDTPEEMNEVMRTQEELDITLVRADGLASLDLCHNMLTHQGVKDLRHKLDCPAKGSLRGWQLSFDDGAREIWLSAH